MFSKKNAIYVIFFALLLGGVVIWNCTPKNTPTDMRVHIFDLNLKKLTETNSDLAADVQEIGDSSYFTRNDPDVQLAFDKGGPRWIVKHHDVFYKLKEDGHFKSVPLTDLPADTRSDYSGKRLTAATPVSDVKDYTRDLSADYQTIAEKNNIAYCVRNRNADAIQIASVDMRTGRVLNSGELCGPWPSPGAIYSVKRAFVVQNKIVFLTGMPHANLMLAPEE